MKILAFTLIVCTLTLSAFTITSASTADKNTNLKACLERASKALSQGNKESCLDAICDGNAVLLNKTEDISIYDEMQFKIDSEDLLAQIATGY